MLHLKQGASAVENVREALSISSNCLDIIAPPVVSIWRDLITPLIASTVRDLIKLMYLMQGASAAGNAREALSSIGSKVASTLNGAAQSVKAATKAEAPAAKPAASQPASQAAKPAASQPAAPLPKPSPQKAVPSPAKPAAMPNGIANGAAPISFVLPSLARSAEPELSEEEQKAKVLLACPSMHR